MPITPLSTPLTMEYKPLGLEAFAVPLSKLQEKFDLTQNQIDKTKYALNTLASDDVRAKKLLGELDDKTKQLSENLTKTGNFRDAAKKLNELNEFYNTNPELAAYKKRYENYKAGYDEMEELRKDPENAISADHVKRWNYYVLNKDQGANYDKATGSYNSGNFSPTGPNLHLEMQEKAANLAKMTKSDGTFDLVRLAELGVSGEEAADLAKLTTKGKSRDQIAGEIYNVLMHIPKYKDFLLKDAEIDFFVDNDKTKKYNLSINQDPFEFSNLTLQNKAFPNLQGRLAIEQSILDNPKANENQKQQAQENITELEEEISNIQEAYANRFNDPEAYEDLAEAYYKANSLGYLNTLSQSTADLVDFVQNDLSGLSSSGGVDKNKQKKIDQIGDIHIAITPVSPTKAPKVRGLSSTYIEEANAEANTQGFTQLFLDNETNMENALATEAYKTVQNGWGIRSEVKIPDIYQYNELPDFYKNQANVHALQEFEQAYSRRIETLDGEIADYNTKLSELTPGSLEHKEISSKLITAYNDRNQTIFAETQQLKDLDFLTAQLFTIIDKSGIAKADKYTFKKKFNDIEKALDQMAGTQGFTFDNFITDLKERYQRKLEFGRGDTEEKFINQFQEMVTLWNKNKSNTTDFLRKAQQVSLDGVVLPISLAKGKDPEEFKVEFKNEMFKSDDIASLMLRSIFDNFKRAKTLGSEGYIQIPEVLYDDNFNNYTDGEMVKLIDQVENTGKSVAPAVVWDPKKRESSLSPNPNYIIEAYKSNPTIMGRDQNGKLILKYVLDPRYLAENKGITTYLGDRKSGRISTESTKTEDRRPIVSTGEGSRNEYFEDNNPDVLYLSVNPMNYSPMLNAEKNYVELTTEGINAFDTNKGINIIEQQRNNFAPIHLVNNHERAFEYTQMAKTLTERAKSGIVGSEVQGPAFEQDLGDGTFMGYYITYKTTRDNQIIAQPVKTIHRKRTESGVPNDIIEKVELPTVNITPGRNLPLSLLKMDMTFGTGNERDLITTRQGGYDVPFIIAFKQGNLFTDPNAAQELLTNIVK